MDWTLVATALLLAAAGSPHCAAMCGAACAAAVGRGGWPAQGAFHALRVAGYAVAGAVAASSVGVLADLGRVSAAFRPLWTLVHAAALVLGLWLMWAGRQPAWMERMGRQRADPGGAAPVVWQRRAGVRAVARSALSGAAWVAWPCGLLQSALLVAALASSPASGAGVMVAFGAVSAVGVAAGPWLLFRVAGRGTVGTAATWPVRLAGAVLAGASAWALGQAAAGAVFCTTH